MQSIEVKPEVVPVEMIQKPIIKKPLGEIIPRVIKHYSVDISDNISMINTVNKFMSFHPEFFKTNIDKKITFINNDQLCTVYLEPVSFYDTIHNVRGFIITEFNTDKKTINMILKIRPPPLRKRPINVVDPASLSSSNIPSTDNIQPTDITPSDNIQPIDNTLSTDNSGSTQIDISARAIDYISKLEIYVNDQIKHGDKVELHYNKILSDVIIKHCYYTQPAAQWEKDVITLQKELFLSNRDYLLSIINHKIDNVNIGSTSSNWNNLILHGPPGSGKSSFIYRVSMTLKLNILSVDLSLFLNRKKELYALFHGQDYNLPNSKPGSPKEPAMSNCIIVLEEFDNSIERLLDIENIFKYKDILKRNYLDLKNKEIKDKSMIYITEKDDSEIDKEVDAKPNSSAKAEDYEDMMEKMMLEDGFDVKNNKIMDQARNDIIMTRSHDNEMHSINQELNNIIKAMDDDNTSNILRKSDLLELFQGPVPIKGRLIIATTNHFKKIKNAMPTLFRAGRMSGVEFSYLDWSSLNDLTNYYFHKSMTIEPFKITIPTSEIVELVQKHVLSKHDINDFEVELSSLCL
jgi:hypothetical protein